MKLRIIATALFSVFLSNGLMAQATKEETLTDLNRTGGVYYAYPVPEKKLTPAPKGYKPVYVSHFGRHGSPLSA